MDGELIVRCLAAGPRERLLESFIRQTVEGAVVMSLNPRTLISITVQVHFAHTPLYARLQAKDMLLKTGSTAQLQVFCLRESL